jgi:hypothetical protein
VPVGVGVGILALDSLFFKVSMAFSNLSATTQDGAFAGLDQRVIDLVVVRALRPKQAED